MARNTTRIWKMKIHCVTCFLGCLRRELDLSVVVTNNGQAGEI